MERSRALLVAAAATVVGVASTVGVAAYTGSGLLGFGRSFGASPAAADASPHDPATDVTTTTTTQPPQVVTQYQDQYDLYVINVPVAGGGDEQAKSDDPAPQLSSLPPGASTGSAASAPAPRSNTAPAQQDESDDAAGEGRDAEDRDGEDAWSKSSTPPMPPGCVDGQLEDNGVWNCQH